MIKTDLEYKNFCTEPWPPTHGKDFKTEIKCNYFNRAQGFASFKASRSKEKSLIRIGKNSTYCKT